MTRSVFCGCAPFPGVSPFLESLVAASLVLEDPKTGRKDVLEVDGIDPEAAVFVTETPPGATGTPELISSFPEEEAFPASVDSLPVAPIDLPNKLTASPTKPVVAEDVGSLPGTFENKELPVDSAEEGAPGVGKILDVFCCDPEDPKLLVRSPVAVGAVPGAVKEEVLSAVTVGGVILVEGCVVVPNKPVPDVVSGFDVLAVVGSDNGVAVGFVVPVFEVPNREENGAAGEDDISGFE